MGVAVKRSYAMHTRLMAEGHKMKVSTVLPPARPHSAGKEERAAEQNPQKDVLKQVPDGRKVAIFFTGNAIGETDPCG